jgi:hypothetical protein
LRKASSSSLSAVRAGAGGLSGPDLNLVPIRAVRRHVERGVASELELEQALVNGDINGARLTRLEPRPGATLAPANFD